MLKNYEAIYENGILNWLSIKPNLTKAKVIVVVEENAVETMPQQSIKKLKGIAPKPERIVSIEEMNRLVATQL